MTFTLDPEVATALGAMFGGQPPPPPPAIGDIEGRRQRIDGMLDLLNSRSPQISDVESKDFYATADDGHQVLLRWYTKTGAAAANAASPGPAVVHIHGGGMIALSITAFAATVKALVSATGVPFLDVEYRLAPEVRAPVPVTDSYAGLAWLHAHAHELGVDRARIGVMGESAGGGIAASLAHYVKQRSSSGSGGVTEDVPAIARQILVYPMLDDRNTVAADPLLAPFAVWSHEDNVTGWDALLGDGRRAGPDVRPVEAAARMTVEDARGLPPAYIDVGQLDLFRDEDIEYARKLGLAGVECELHLIPGVPHAFEGVAPEARVSKFASEQRLRAIKSI